MKKILMYYSKMNNTIPSAPPLIHVPDEHVFSILENIINDQVTVRDEQGLRSTLATNGWPLSLRDFFIQNIQSVYMRYFIYDDSGSMSTCDGEKFFGKHKSQCSRWDELSETMKFQIEACRNGWINAKFIKLNGCSCKTDILHQLPSDFMNLTGGTTPLCRTLYSIINEIRAIEFPLRQTGKTVTVMIATDGVSSDGDISIPLAILKELPVNIVLRLCTNDDKIIKYWNSIDQELELRLDVLDGFCSEAKEVYKCNPWLCYTKAIHQMREFGIREIVFDHIDERSLPICEIRKIARIIYGSDVNTNQEIRLKNLEKQYCTVRCRYREYVTFPSNSHCVIT